MSFHSINYLIFFPIVAALYYLIPRSYQRHLLLIASALFYLAFFPIFIFLPIFLIFLDYFSAHYIEKLKGNQKKFLIIATIILNLLPLLIFKYSGFLSLNFILPLGLSFYTLQSIGYIIDVYRSNQKAEKQIGNLALFIMFFPQILSGPIERASRMIPQFKEPHFFDETRITNGLLLILFGFYKKVVIADNLAIITDQASPPLAALAFTFQIYYDFSGYTDIARGSAKVLGFDLIENFNHPYLSTSIQDFWKRWHISLSSWLRDYVYIPLGGSRVGKPRKYLNIFITFLVSGFWHGAGWNFLIWGAFNGLAIIAADLFSNFKTLSRLTSTRLISIPVNFLLICLGWTIFRSGLITKTLNPVPIIISEKIILIIVSSILLMEFSPRLPRWTYWILGVFAAIAILNLGVVKSVPFIYSNF